MSQDIEKIIREINWDSKPINLYSPIAYTMESGGKRLRPMLADIAFEMFSGSGDTIKDAARAIEVFHNFTLLHDDLMDNSPTRRNRPTVHTRWNANTAILSGDAMLIKAYEFLGKTPARYWEKLLPLFTKTALEVCEGQQFDMDFETIDDICIEDYFEMIRLKTAVLLACALKMGAILADASDDDQQTIYSLGIALGMAFQLKDDYLDTYGTTETLGKRVGDDILSYKKTFLLLTALHKADDSQKKRLVSAMSAKDITDEQKIKTVTRIYNELDIPQICEKVIDEYYIQANNLLEKISVPSESKETLKTLINKLKIREK